jgi:hypothetical protein
MRTFAVHLNLLSFEAFDGQTVDNCSLLHLALFCEYVCQKWSATLWRSVPIDILEFYIVG